MIGAPYTIRIFLPAGDPQGVRLVDRVGWTGDAGKYQIIFAEPAKGIGPIAYGGAPSAMMRRSRDTSLTKLPSAQELMDVFA